MSKSERLSVKQLFELYSNHSKPETCRKVYTAIRRLVARPDSPPSKINLLDVERRREQLLSDGVKGQTINTYCASLSGMWNWAQKRGYIDLGLNNPYKALNNLPSDIERETRDLTDNEVKSLLASSEGINNLRWALHIYTGLRWINIHNLTWSQIDDDFIKLPATSMKSGRGLNVPICDNLKIIIKKYQDTAKYDRVFRRRSYPTILKYFRVDCEKAGIERPDELGLHSLRHTYATKLYHSGVPILTISRLLDHSSVSVTENYLHLKADEMTKAVANLSY